MDPMSKSSPGTGAGSAMAHSPGMLEAGNAMRTAWLE